MLNRPGQGATGALVALTLAVALVAGLAGCEASPQTQLAEARRLIVAKRPADAIIVLKSVLQGQPDLGDARLLLGTSLLAQGEVVAAESELRRARALGQPADVVVPALARCQQAQGQHRALVDEWRDARLGQAQAQADLHTMVAQSLLALGERAAATSQLMQVLAMAPAFAPAQLLQARVEAGTGDIAMAQHRVDAVLATAPDSADAWALKADLALHAGRAYEAMALYGRALSLQPQLVRAHVAIISLQLAKRDLDAAKTQLKLLRLAAPAHPLTLLFDGQLAFIDGDLHRADERFQRLLESAPDNLLALQSAGAVALQSDAPARAERLLGRALQLSPELPQARRLLAQAQLALGQPTRALATLTPLFDTDGGDAEALTLAAQIHLLNGDAAAAELMFKRASAKAPDNAKVRTALALSHLAKGQTERTLSELTQVSASDAGVSADLALISTLLRQRSWAPALAAIDTLDRKQPKRPMAALLRGQVLQAKADRAGARQAFEQALQREPGHLGAVVALANLDLTENKEAAGQARFDALIAAQPENPAARLALAQWLQRRGAGREAVAQVLEETVKRSPTDRGARLALIDHHLATLRPAAALLAAQTALASVPGDPDLLLRVALGQRATGAVQQAVTSFNQLIAAQPRALSGYLALAETLLAQKDSAGASKILVRAMALAPQSLPARQLAVVAALGQRQTDEALKLARQLQSRQPDDAVGYLLEGDIHLALNDWPTAVATLKKALVRRDPAQTPARLHHALLQAGQPEEAARLAQQWRQDHADDALFAFYLGDQALRRLEWREALGHYQAVLKLRPDHGLALNNVAWVLLQMHKPEALSYAQRAVKALPDHPSAMDTLAGSLAAAGQYEAALAWSKRALSISPDDPGLRLGLTRVYALAGRRDLAQTELDALARLGDSFIRQDEVRSLRAALAATR